jgi:hypothetical protein
LPNVRADSWVELTGSVQQSRFTNADAARQVVQYHRNYAAGVYYGWEVRIVVVTVLENQNDPYPYVVFGRPAEPVYRIQNLSLIGDLE